MMSESLYERLGGDAGTKALVVKFYARVMGDSRLSPFFANTSMEKLIEMQREFFGAALGGPENYSGAKLTRAHAGRGIGAEHFNWFIQHLLETLEESGVPEEDVQAVVARLAPYKNDITGESY